MATNVHLTPELERFARKCVKSGRYNNVSEVVRSALRLMFEQEKRRRSFAEMLDAARMEAERAGVHDAEAVAAEMDRVIRGARR
jgi:antitoxin ParD1/3/4